MSATDTTTAPGQAVDAERDSTWRVLMRGFRLSPEFTAGIGITLLLSLISTGGRVVVPVAVQQTIDRGIMADGGPDQTLVGWLVALSVLSVVLTGVCSYAANVRLYKATESGLVTLRTKAFRHIHDLSVLTQNTQRRGSLVSRVTSDVDTISTFVQWGGLLLVVSAGQILVATVLMAFYSWQLTLVVWAFFLPVFLLVPRLQRLVSVSYLKVRERVGDLLGAVSEAVVGADTVRAYGIEARTQRRMNAAIEAHRRQATHAGLMVIVGFCGGVLVSGLVVAAAVTVGVWIGVRGELTLGGLLAFMFLVQLFTGPVMMATEVLNELQNAAAGWRRVMGVLDTPADVADPPEGVTQARGPVEVRFCDVGYAYPDGPPVLTDVNLTFSAGTRVAIVGETGSGKTTLAKLLTRLMDPVSGQVLLDGVDLRRIKFASLRERIVMVPQEGFLFDDSLVANIAWGHTGATRETVTAALAELGLLDWALALPRGLDTAVGPRGESLSVGERQLVALARAYLAAPDLLVLDEATSSVDPATEVRIQRALAGVTRGRTSVAIAHRLSTAEAADLVVVVDAGRVVDVGPHREVLARGGVYGRLHESWTSQLQDA